MGLVIGAGAFGQSVIGFKDSSIPKELVDVLPKVEAKIPVAFYSFAGTNLPLSLDYLTRSLPASIVARIQSLPDHQLTKDELEAEAAACIERARTDVGKALATAVALRDADAALQNTDLTKINNQRDLIGRLNGAWRRALILQPGDLYQTGRRTLSVPTNDTELSAWTGQLTGPGVPAASALRSLWEKKGALFMVWGRVESQGDFVAVRVVVAQTLLNTIVVDETRRYQLADIQNAGGELAELVEYGLLGYYPSSVAVVARPESAEVQISPNIRGKRDLTWPVVEPGTYTLTVRAAGYQTQTFDIAVQAGQDLVVPVKLEGLGARNIQINSDPSGARVYEGASYLGLTPFDYAEPTSDRLLFVQMEGYGRQALQVGSHSPNQLNVHLYPKYLDWNAEVVARRDQVYYSLGFLGLSLAIPIVFDGLLQTEVNNYAATNTSQSSFLQSTATRANTYYYLRTIGIGISVVMLIDVLSNIAAYVDAANQLDLVKVTKEP